MKELDTKVSSTRDFSIMRSLCSALYFLSSTERNGFLMNIYSEVLGRCRSKMAAPMFTCTFSCG